jgi:hypothetical protein
MLQQQPGLPGAFHGCAVPYKQLLCAGPDHAVFVLPLLAVWHSQWHGCMCGLQELGAAACSNADVVDASDESVRKSCV